MISLQIGHFFGGFHVYVLVVEVHGTGQHQAVLVPPERKEDLLKPIKPRLHPNVI